MDKSIGKILVPVDGSANSARAAAFAFELADKYDSEVFLIHILPIGEFIRGLGTGEPYNDSLEKATDDLKKRANKWLDAIVKKANEGARIRTDIFTSTSSVVRTIVDYARREHIDHIIIGTRGQTNVANVLLGSVASGVVNSSPCSVTVIK